jgi:hypothetical protein
MSQHLQDVAQILIDNDITKECYPDLDHARNVYLALKEVQSSIPLLTTQREWPYFFLKHMDDKGDHIFVEDNNITGIIDWEWAQTLPANFAFNAPLFLVDIGAYYDGKDGLSEDEQLFVAILEEKGHRELADHVRAGRIGHRLAHLLDESLTPDDLRLHLCSFLRLLGKGDQSFGVWKDASLKSLKDDCSLAALEGPR